MNATISRAAAHADADTIDRQQARYTAIRLDGTRFPARSYRWAADLAMGGFVVDHNMVDHQHHRLAGDVLVLAGQFTLRRGPVRTWHTYPAGTEAVVVAIWDGRREHGNTTYLVELPGEALATLDSPYFENN